MIITSDSDKKVVVLGLDGATFDIIRPMIAEGRLKNFCQINRKRKSGQPDFYYTASFLSRLVIFCVRSQSAKHGMYDFSKRVDGFVQLCTCNFSGSRSKSVSGNMLQMPENGVLIVNVPLTYPPEKVNGVMISGFPYPESRRDFAWPKDVIDEIKNAVRHYIYSETQPSIFEGGRRTKESQPR